MHNTPSYELEGLFPKCKQTHHERTVISYHKKLGSIGFPNESTFSEIEGDAKEQGW